MKPTTINVQITKCPKQYEAVRLGMECTIDAGETVESAIKAATEQLTAIYEGMINPQAKPAAAPATPAAPAPEPAKEPTRERLAFGDKRVQQIGKRMEAQPGRAKEILEQTLKYFDPTEEVMKTLNLAAKLV